MKRINIIVSALLVMLFFSCEKAFITGSNQYTFDEELVAISDTIVPEVEITGKKGVCFVKRDKKWPVYVSMFKPFWHYSWGLEITEHDVPGVEFVPMFWGAGASQTAIDKMLSYKQDGLIKYILGFNEPDSKNQSNVSVEKALETWPRLESIGLPLGSPATVNPEGDWMKEFMAGATRLGLRIDFVCVHNYGGASAQAFLNKIERVYQLYGKPIWITEFAVADWQATTPEENKFSPSQVLNFMKAVLPELERRDYVQRYSWFSFGIQSSPGTSSALFDQEGNFTELGQYYANFAANEECGEGIEIPDLEPAGGNLLVNGDFETGTFEGWTTVANVVIEKNVHINGTASARLTGNSSSDRKVIQSFNVEGGKTYTLKFTARIHNGFGAEGVNENDNGGEFYAHIKIGSGNPILLVTLTEHMNTTKSANFTVPAGETEATITFSKNKNIAVLDDVEIVPAEE